MRVLSAMVLIPLILIIGLFFSENPNHSPEDLARNISDVHDKTFNITKVNFNYTNLYEEKPTTDTVIFNFLHGITYGLLVEYHTLIPVLIYGASDTDVILRIVIWILVIWLVTKIFVVAYGIIALWFFIKEKRKYKEKAWQ